MELLHKRRTLKIGSISVIILVIIYALSLLYWVYGRKVQTDIINSGTIEETFNTYAYVIRNEEVLKSPFTGKCITDAEEGEKVALGSRIATILNGSSQKLFDELKEKDLAILKAQKGKNSNMELFSDDIARIDDEISQKLKLIIAHTNNGSLVEIKKIRNDIDELMQKKATIFGKSSKSDSYIESLKREKEQIQQKIKANTQDIYSAASGIISYEVDGYEATFTPKSIKDITPAALNNIKIKESMNYSYNFNVESEKPFAKIIKDIDYYLVIAVDKDKARLFSVDDVVEIKINDIGEIISGTVNFKSNEEDGKYIISINTDKALSETAGLRKLNIDLIKTRHEGLKVPVKSLLDLDMESKKAKIVLVKDKYTKICEINIVGKNEDYAIIEGVDKGYSKNSVGLYDIFVVSPGKIEEGQLIDQ